MSCSCASSESEPLGWIGTPSFSRAPASCGILHRNGAAVLVIRRDMFRPLPRWRGASERGMVSSVVRGKEPEHDSAAELLADWRSAGRDTVAAKSAAAVAALAVAAAAAAEEAAEETEAAARAAMEAAILAKSAAERAKQAARHAAEAALLFSVTTEGDRARADQAVTEAEHAEQGARDRFHVAQEEGFPKDSD